MTEISGRVALVTGAGRGIGAETAHQLAAQGGRVVLLSRTSHEIDQVAARIRDEGGEALAITGDVSSYEEVVSAVQRTIDTYGALDILVNNAGVIDPIGELADTDEDRWSRAIDINLKGVYHGIKAVIPAMLTRGAGTIINVSSGAATEVFEGWSSYCASKAAVLALTRVADQEYRARGIRVIGLVPGTVATDMQVAIKASGINRVSKRELSDHFPVEWPASAILWLCSQSGDPYLGTDFSIKDPANRILAGIE